MTLRTPPSWLQGGTHTAENDRLMLRGLVGTQGVGSGSTELQVTQLGTPSMNVQVAAGWGWVLGTTTSSQGMYSSYNDAAVTLAVGASHATLLRIDLVCFTVQDAAYAGALNNCVLQVVAGTPAASPVAPATPASSLVLAQVAIGAGVTTIVNANITDSRTRAALAMAAAGQDPTLSLMLGGM